MPRSANITSLDSIPALAAALRQFEADGLAAVTALELECRRPADWIGYWPREAQQAADAVLEARRELERCELSLGGEEGRYCFDERKALERAQRRLRTAEEKVRELRRWRIAVRKEVEEFQVQLSRLRLYLESELPRSIAALGRMGTALEQYAAQATPAVRENPA
jgi:hypothetical protein